MKKINNGLLKETLIKKISKNNVNFRGEKNSPKNKALALSTRKPEKKASKKLRDAREDANFTKNKMLQFLYWLDFDLMKNEKNLNAIEIVMSKVIDEIEFQDL